MSTWIRPETRLAIYARDGYRCVYHDKVFDAADLSLDHLDPRQEGGDHTPYNLITACVDCNSARKAMPWRQWVASRFPPDQVEQIERRIYTWRRRRIDRIRQRTARAQAVEGTVADARCPWCADTCSGCLQGFLDTYFRGVPLPTP